MIKKFFVIFIAFALVLNTSVKAEGDDEGMWLPLLVQKLNMKKMKKMGLKLKAEDIYSVNKSSLKDAIISLDYGSCTGEIVSAKGLFLTNHHCGYGEIQAHSSVKNDYLTDGFWAKTMKDELPNPNKVVSFLIRIEDVTDKINSKLDDDMSEDARRLMIKNISKKLEAEAKGDSHYEVKVQSFFKGNDFYLFVYETFKDVRLVGAPPSSIGKYGADTDNWMWPRHTGDFSMFRIYCGPDGKPAEYSEENIPLKVKHYLPVSIKGVEKDDFAMVFGYPGSTTRYLSSWGVEQTMENENKIRIKLRGLKQEIMKSEMDKSDAARIMYASKYSRSTNYYKYSIGQNNGLKNLNVIAKKQKIEEDLTKWIDAKSKRKDKYGNSLSLIKNSVKEGNKYNIISNYWFESFWGGAEAIKFSLNNSRGLGEAVGNKELMDELKKEADDFFKNYYQPIDINIFVTMMNTYKKDIDKEFYPEFFTEVDNKYGGNFRKYAEDVFSKSVYTDKKRFDKFFKNVDVSTLSDDPMVKIAGDILKIYFDVREKTNKINDNLTKGERLFVAALLKKEKKKSHYPDANSTMRLTYGKVGDYEPRDAVIYKHYTTLEGYMEKEDPTNEEFFVHKKLKELYNKKDYGEYGHKLPNGDVEMRVCFTTDNDITGGNSGSPVINGNGELIGIAFDGNWEAMSGDIAFETELQKCINVDIRYVLFVIDKYAGAKRLIKEMKIVK